MTAISIEVIIKLCMTLKKYGNFEIYFARTFPFTLIIFYSLFFVLSTPHDFMLWPYHTSTV